MNEKIRHKNFKAYFLLISKDSSRLNTIDINNMNLASNVPTIPKIYAKLSPWSTHKASL